MARLWLSYLPWNREKEQWLCAFPTDNAGLRAQALPRYLNTRVGYLCPSLGQIRVQGLWNGRVKMEWQYLMHIDGHVLDYLGTLKVGRKTCLLWSKYLSRLLMRLWPSSVPFVPEWASQESLKSRSVFCISHSTTTLVSPLMPRVNKTARASLGVQILTSGS